MLYYDVINDSYDVTRGRNDLSKGAGYFHIVAIVNKAAINMGCRSLFEVQISFPLRLYPEVLLNHMVALFLVF